MKNKKALQFNEYFVQNNLIPTLKELMVRMSDTEDTTSKGEYLKVLFKGQKLDSQQRKDYHRDFFGGSNQPTNRPFMDESERQFRDDLINELGIYIKQRKNLSGEKGMMTALFPSGDSTFESSTGLQKNMNLLAYRLVAKFEKNKVQELKGGEKISKEDKEKLESGKFILVTINDKEQVIAKGEQIPAGAIVAFVQPDLLRRIQEGTSAERPTPQSEAPEIKSTAEELARAFEESELESMRDFLEKSGLEVIDLHKKGDEFVGIVETEERQRLDVRIDPKAASDNAWKFTFTFKEPTPGTDEIRGFHLSQDDLAKKFMAGGIRQTAENVYRHHLPESAKFKKHEMPVSETPPVEARPVMHGPIAGPAAGEEGKMPVTIKAKGEVIIPAVPMPTGAAPAPPTPAAPARRAVQRRPSPVKAKKRVIGVPKTKPAAAPPPKKKTVRQKKKETQARRQAAQQAAQQAAMVQQMQQRQMFAAQQQQMMQQQQARQRAAAKRKKGSGVKWIAAGIGGTLTGIGGTLAAAVGIAKQDTEAVSFILNCIGSICIG